MAEAMCCDRCHAFWTFEDDIKWRLISSRIYPDEANRKVETTVHLCRECSQQFDIWMKG